MNKFSLTFLDRNLEEKYQESQKTQILNCFKINSLIPILSYIIFGAYMVANSQISLASGYFILAFIYMIFFYKIAFKKEMYKYIEIIICSFSISASIMQFIPFWIDSISSIEHDWIEDTVIQMGLHVNRSQNPIINALLLIIFVGTRIYYRSIFEFNPLCLIFILYAILTFYHEYQRVNSLRYQFLWKEINQNQYFIFDDLFKESLVVLNYNYEWANFKCVFANKSFYTNYHDNPIEFLKEIQLSQHKMTAMTYLHYQIGTIKNQFIFEGYLKNRNQHLIFECQQYSIIDTQLVLKISSKKSYSENNVYPLLYKGILKKLKKIDRHQYHTESLKNLLAALLTKPQSIVNFKISTIDYSKLNALLMNILRDNSAVYKLSLTSDQFYTKIPLLYILMISISKYYKISTFYVHQLNVSIIELQVKGKIKKNTIQNQQFFEKLIRILVDLIGIQSLRIENFYFTCKIMNMESPFISTMN